MKNIKKIINKNAFVIFFILGLLILIPVTCMTIFYYINGIPFSLDSYLAVMSFGFISISLAYTFKSIDDNQLSQDQLNIIMNLLQMEKNLTQKDINNIQSLINTSLDACKINILLDQAKINKELYDLNIIDFHQYENIREKLSTIFKQDKERDDANEKE